MIEHYGGELQDEGGMVTYIDVGCNANSSFHPRLFESVMFTLS